MDRKLAGMLSVAGIVMGIASVMGWTQHREGVLWLVIAIASAFVIAREAPGKYFLHGLWTGLLAGIASALIQLAMYSTYLANNPDSAAQIQTMPANWNPRVMLLIFAPVIGLLNGLVIGFLSWLGARMLKPRLTA